MDGVIGEVEVLCTFDADVIARAARHRAQDRLNLVLEGAAIGVRAGAHIVLNHHEWLIEARLYHGTCKVAIDIDGDLAARIQMADLRGCRAAKGVPEDAEACEVEPLAPHGSWRRVQSGELVHDE